MSHSVLTCVAELVALSGLLGLAELLEHLGFSSVGRGYFHGTLSFDLLAELVAHLWLAFYLGPGWA